MAWAPAPSADVVRVAVPPLRDLVPSVVVPSRKVTEPVGVPTPGDVTVTVAVRVTGCPNTGAVGDTVSVVVVEAWLTCWLTGDEALPMKFESPTYTAVIEWEIPESEDVVNVA